MPPVRRFVLASASPSRRRLLDEAGLRPEVVVSGVDEETDIPADPSELALTLAVRKARAVARKLSADALVLGCDSVLDIDGTAYGKPDSATEVVDRWMLMAGSSGYLRTGHCIVDNASGGEAIEVVSTVVRFGAPSDAELRAYVATGEPLAVAGAFTLDGYGAPFIDGVEGDPGNVIGVSLPAVRRLLAQLGVGVHELWR